MVVKHNIINKIAAEFPYSIGEVRDVYINNGYSEDKTRKILMRRMITGR